MFAQRGFAHVLSLHFVDMQLFADQKLRSENAVVWRLNECVPLISCLHFGLSNWVFCVKNVTESPGKYPFIVKVTLKVPL